MHPFIVQILLLVGLTPSVLGAVALPGPASSRLSPELKGWVLIEELNCVACHGSDGPVSARSKKAPRLAAVGSRVNPYYLEAFLRDPQVIKPGATMPDVLGAMGSDERKEAATALTHYLLSMGTNEFFLQPPDAVAATLGERLFHARGCAACHSPRDARGAELLPETSVPLGALEKKYSFRSLVDFLRQPHATRPSGRMPDLRLPGPELERIAHYLLRATRVPGHVAYTLYRGDVWEGLGSENVKPERAGYANEMTLESIGRVSHHSAIQFEGWLNIPATGRYTFHLQMNGGSLHVDGRPVVELEPSDRRGVRTQEGAIDLDAGWRRIVLIYFHTGQQPRFSCEMAGPGRARQPIPSAMLSVANEVVPALPPFPVRAGLAERGREYFANLGCANCHDDLRVPARPGRALGKLDPARGCLGTAAGPWPRFDLSADQRAWITAALTRGEGWRLDDRQLLDKTLVTFNCIACHDRDGLGGIAPERNAIFTGTREALGDQGRLPPPLTQVGAKLSAGWMTAVLLHGQRQRSYVDASMPQFGEANVGFLVDLFGKVDALEPVTFPKVADRPAAKRAGLELVGSTGLSCIACHDFNGQKAAGPGALDIVHAAERLQKNWFHLYLRNPARFHPTGIMPAYWPDGQSARPDILGGDAALQIEALWVYLEDGTRVKRPAGLSRQASELRVGDVAEICRGRSSAGYRSIGVGYPERINLIFESEEMALRQLWKGEFANVDLGFFEARGRDRISFPRGIPFHRLRSMDDHWPYKGKTNHPFPQDHGYQFRGYELDALRRPTFRYRYGDIAVEDYFEDVRDAEGRAWFRRTFRFDTAVEPAPFHFRAATGRKIVRQSDRAFLADQLQLRILSDHRAVTRDGDPGEILIPLVLPRGRSILTLEYQW